MIILLSLIGASVIGWFVHKSVKTDVTATKGDGINEYWIRIDVTPFVSAYQSVISWLKTTTR
jgi:hypothetical protein